MVEHQSYFYAQSVSHNEEANKQFIVNDSNLKAEMVISGLEFPTGIAFLGVDDILVLEKDKGTVRRIVNGQLLEKPLLQVNVSGYGEGGMLGIAAANSTNSQGTKYLFLYLTESRNPNSDSEKKEIGNRIYRYELIDGTLENPKLLLNLPASDRGLHNGGKIVIGPYDGNLYTIIGDIGRNPDEMNTEAQNYDNGTEADGTGGILWTRQNGQLVNNEGILGDEHPLNMYYAYGIRNGFGIDFDPLTKELWDTENVDFDGDEINLVEPGFNSGWRVIEGMAESKEDFSTEDLVDFEGKGEYSDPEFTWSRPYGPIGPTALKFLNSEMYGQKYENDMFVGDFNYGRIYHFDLNTQRTELDLNGSLKDKVASQEDEFLSERIFAEAPGAVVDLQVGPEGYLYVVSLYVDINDCDIGAPGCLVADGPKGAIFRIVPAKSVDNDDIA
jgi:glucose/arabinose dehydrogenase